MTKEAKQVLVVDDSPTVRRLAELILNQEGFIVHTAEDGEKGLQMARSIEPEVILVDYVMPNMNGHSFCKELRCDEKFKDIPLILISSKGEAVGQSFEKEFGVVHYFSKPFEPDELVQKLQEVLASEPAEQKSDAAEAAKYSGGGAHEMLNAIQEKFDKIIRSYFQKDFPLLMKNVMTDTLRHSGLVKDDTLVLTGRLSHIPLPDILNFSDNSRLSGRLTVFAKDTFGEIFLENGRFVFATVSRKGGHNFLTDIICHDRRLTDRELSEAVKEARDKNQPIGTVLVENNLLTREELMNYLQQHALQSFTRILEVKEGNFYLEADELPVNLRDIDFRLPLTNVLLEALSTLDEKDLAETEFSDEDVILVRLITNEDALDDINLGEREMLVFAIIDGRKTLTEVIKLAGLAPRETKHICYVLRRLGLLRIRHQKD